MAKNETTALAVNPNGLTPAEVADLQRFVSSGFSEEKSFWIGDPADGKVGAYFGEIIGEGEPVYLERMGAKPDETTGEVPMQAIPCYLFHPLNPQSFQPLATRTDNVICNAAVAAACKRYLNLAKAKGARAQVLMRWAGKGKSRKGFQFNQIETMFRLVTDTGAIMEAGSSAPSGNG